MISEPKLYVLPILHRVALSSLIPNEHYVLKDLPFYKVTRLADLKARQARLKEREKKRHEGTLRQGPATSHLISGSAAPPSANKKKTPNVRPIQRVRTPPPAPPSSPYASSSLSSSSSSTTSSEPETGADRVVPFIICEEENEGDMAKKLRVGFYERQRKNLSKSITVSLSPPKRPCPDPTCPEPIPVPALVPAPSTTAA